MQHLRHGRSVIGEGIGGDVTFPLRGLTNDDIDAKTEARRDRLLE